MPFAQFVLTRTPVGGRLKLVFMSVERVERVHRGGALFVLWQIARHLSRLRPAKP